MGLIIVLTVLLAIICLVILMKKGKKILVRSFVGILLVISFVYGMFFLVANFYTKNTNLQDVKINGYFVNQDVNLNEVENSFSKLEESEADIIYKINNSNLIYVTISKKTNKVILVEGYFDEGLKESSLFIPSMGNLIIGKSTFLEYM